MKILAAMLLSVIMLSSGFMINSPAIAAPNENANEKAKVRVPENAVEIAPGIFHIGTVMHEGKLIEGIMAFHHRAGHDGGGGPGGGGPGGGGNGGGDKCFAFLARGAAWNNAEDYGIDTSNEAGLTGQFIRSTIASSLEEWDDAAGFEIFDSNTQSVDGPDTVSPDNKNEVLFADIDSPGAIAVTIVWGIFGGPPSGRVLVEWDAVFDDVDFAWSNNGEAGKMDFENIAQHEFGHAGGLGHPGDTCTEETMYRFASLGETKKRTLNSGDIAGILSLYS